VQQAGMGGMFRMVTACPVCGGRGTVIKEFCDACRGKGRVPKNRKLTVQIPAGISEGQMVRVRGEGEPPSPEESPNGDGVRGDLHVAVRIKAHQFYQRENDHLIVEMPISFSKASLGGGVALPTIDGKKATLTVPRGTQYGTMFRMAGQGMPSVRNGQRGDMIVIAKLETPKKLSAEQERLLREFAKTENESVLPESQGFWRRVKERFA
jgi:molecular chaperone DnaJ